MTWMKYIIIWIYWDWHRSHAKWGHIPLFILKSVAPGSQSKLFLLDKKVPSGSSKEPRPPPSLRELTPSSSLVTCGQRWIFCQIEDGRRLIFCSYFLFLVKYSHYLWQVPQEPPPCLFSFFWTPWSLPQAPDTAADRRRSVSLCRFITIITT